MLKKYFFLGAILIASISTHAQSSGTYCSSSIDYILLYSIPNYTNARTEWQVNTGSGFNDVNFNDSVSYYLSITGDSLYINPIDTFMNGWPFLAIDSVSLTFSNDSGEYDSTVYDTNLFIIFVIPSPTPMVGSNSPVCAGSTLNLTASTSTAKNGATYSWTGPHGFTSNKQNPNISSATTQDSGKYYVTITSSSGCSAIDSIVVTVHVCGFLQMYNSVSNNSKFSQPFLMETSIDSNKQTFKICADGSDATIFKFKCGDSCKASNLRFRIVSSITNSDTGVTGYFKHSNYLPINNDTLAARFTHPSYLPSGTGLFRRDSLQVIDSTTGTVLFVNPLDVFRAPILFVHGFNSDQSCFETMEQSFISSGLFPPVGSDFSQSPLLYKVDYSATHNEHYSVNRKVLPNGIDVLMQLARNSDYSCGKVISVGHSMGGILTRLYLQNSWSDVSYRNDLEKVITVNTPHYGSQFANWGLWVLANSPALFPGLCAIINAWSEAENGIHQTNNSILTNLHAGAIEDLAVNSWPNNTLLDISTFKQPYKVPSVTLSTDGLFDNSKIAFVIRTILSPFIVYDSLYENGINDLIVELKSQQCGITDELQLSNAWHCTAPIISTMTAKVQSLLDEDPKDFPFTQTGFPPGNLVLPHNLSQYQPRNINRNGTERSTGTSDSVKITYPVTGKTYSPGDTVQVKIFFSGSDISQMALFVLGNSISPITIDTNAVNELIFTIPDSTVGVLNVSLLGGDSTGWYASDTANIIIIPNAPADSIVCNPGETSVAWGLDQFINVEGYFNGRSTPVSLLDFPGLSIQYDTSYLIYLGNSTFQAKDTGATVVTYTYEGQSDSSILTIYNDPSVLTAAFNYSTTQVCQGDSVTFTDESQGLVTGYQWGFPGGSPSSSTQANPVVMYPSVGVYTVSLKTTFINGVDSILLDSLITVENLPAPTVSQTINTLYTQSGDITYNWYYGVDSTSFNLILSTNSDSLNVSNNGFYYVDVTDLDGCSSSSSAFRYIATGINQLSANSSQLSIYPNPSSGQFTIKLNGNKIDYTVEVYNVIGEKIYQAILSNSQDVIDLSTHPAGMYFIYLKSDVGVESRKALVTK